MQVEAILVPRALGNVLRSCSLKNVPPPPPFFFPFLQIKTRRLSGISPRTVAGDTVHRIAWRRAVLLCFF